LSSLELRLGDKSWSGGNGIVDMSVDLLVKDEVSGIKRDIPINATERRRGLF